MQFKELSKKRKSQLLDSWLQSSGGVRRDRLPGLQHLRRSAEAALARLPKNLLRTHQRSKRQLWSQLIRTPPRSGRRGRDGQGLGGDPAPEWRNSAVPFQVYRQWRDRRKVKGIKTLLKSQDPIRGALLQSSIDNRSMIEKVNKSRVLYKTLVSLVCGCKPNTLPKRKISYKHHGKLKAFLGADLSTPKGRQRWIEEAVALERQHALRCFHPRPLLPSMVVRSRILPTTSE